MATVICNRVGEVGIGSAAEVLARGDSALDAVEQGIRPVESDPRIHSVGRGGWPNMLGEVELDACIMDGATLRAGAVGALQGYLHPISIARQVMECLPHVLLVGDGAARFAAERGMEPADNLTAEAQAYYDRWCEGHLDPDVLSQWPQVALAPYCRRATDPEETHGTTVFLALDQAGHMAAGVSTSGWALKYPGRLGDSPIIGAGAYVDDRYGAAACIGQGELAIRAGTARSVVLYLKMGLDLEAACREAGKDLQRMAADLHSFVMIHALSAQGEPYALCWGNHPDPEYWVWKEGFGEPILQPADEA